MHDQSGRCADQWYCHVYSTRWPSRSPAADLLALSRHRASELTLCHALALATRPPPPPPRRCSHSHASSSREGRVSLLMSIKAFVGSLLKSTDHRPRSRNSRILHVARLLSCLLSADARCSRQTSTRLLNVLVLVALIVIDACRMLLFSSRPLLPFPFPYICTSSRVMMFCSVIW